MKAIMLLILLIVNFSASVYGFRNGPSEEGVDIHAPPKPVTYRLVTWDFPRPPDTPPSTEEIQFYYTRLAKEKQNCDMIGGVYHEVSLFQDTRYNYVASLAQDGREHWVVTTLGHCSCANPSPDKSNPYDKIIVSFTFGLKKCDPSLVELEYMKNYDPTPYINDENECRGKGGSFKLGDARDERSQFCLCGSWGAMKENQTCNSGQVSRSR